MTQAVDEILVKLERPMSHYDYAVVIGHHGAGGHTYMITNEGSACAKVFSGQYDEAQAVADELNGIITATRRLKGEARGQDE